MASPAPIQVSVPESSVSVASVTGSPSQKTEEGRDPWFSNLRGVQWRISLGILPSSSSIEELRRVTADSRRRYAGLRRCLFVDPHFQKDGSSSPDLVIDNPLSQNPDSSWGRFFRIAELKKMVDQDLVRLYPEQGSYFHTPACQGMLKRILLLWCRSHPECSYRQGMHELLAPLLYVLHVDVQRLSEVRKLYEDHFIDKFDGISFPESDLVCNYKSLQRATAIEDDNNFLENLAKARSLDELDLEIQTIVLLNDAYGAEGELGVLLSERFMEHDAYCMFDALMGGSGGAVAMSEYFSPAPASGSHTGVPPVIEASCALYHLLSIVDSSLHSHLVELGVEPQYFALRWLRVLFGREFSLDDLLVIWDEIFMSDNSKSSSGVDNEEYGCEVLRSPREAFISAMSVSMLLHMRSSLLATEHATSCLQRLLNFPQNVDVKKLIAKAKSLQVLALQAGISSPPPSLIGSFERANATSFVRGQSLPSHPISPKTPLNLVPESYWEERWRVAQKAEELQKEGMKKQASHRKKGLSEKFKFSLVRTESDPSPAKKSENGKKESRVSVRRRLLDDLARVLGSDEDLEKVRCSEEDSAQNDLFSDAVVEERNSHDETIKENGLEKNFSCVPNSTSLSGRTGSEETSSIFSASSSSLCTANDHHENESEKSSVASNLSGDENEDIEPNNKEEPSEEGTSEEPSLPVSDLMDSCDCKKPELVMDPDGPDRKQVSGLKEQRKPLLGKFPWFWKFGRSPSEGTSEKGGIIEAPRSQSTVTNQNDVSASSSNNGYGTSTGEMPDKNVMATLKNLGQSMLENIQVIESVFQQDRGGQVGSLENLSRSILVGKRQVTAVAALKELRKISNLLSEM